MRRFVTGIACLLLLTGFAETRLARAVDHDPQQAATSQEKPAAVPAGYVGQETCATCHADVVKKFANNPHARLALEHAGKGVTCESCHGPGLAHVEGGGDITKIRRFDKMTPRQINEICLGCHSGNHPNWQRSPHASAGLSCLSCHSVHASVEETGLATAPLLRVDQPKLCYQCHGDVKAAFGMPFHHPVNEGAVTCNDCHDVHGTFGENNLMTTADQNQICTKCHMETRGPFVYEHAPVKAEGCMACHTPHGSQNARLLNMPNIDVLCAQCHNYVAMGAVHGIGGGSTTLGLSRGTTALAPCTSCHAEIHGSNLSWAFLE